MTVTASPPSARVVSAHRLILDTPVTVEIAEEPLPGGPRNRMTLTVWTEAGTQHDPSASQAARALTIGFLERALEAVRAMPAASFGAGSGEAGRTG